MSLTKLNYFVSVAELSSFTQAAKKHYISQTAISQQIASLEKELNIKLFDRTINPIQLTEAGQVFYKDVKTMLSQYQNAIQKAQHTYKNQNRILTVGYSSFFEIQLISDIVVKFQELHPEVEITFIKKNIDDLLSALGNGTCDVAFATDYAFDENNKKIKQYPIFKGSMLLGVGKKHPKVNQKTIDSKELQHEKIIFLSEEPSSLALKGMIENCRADGYEPCIIEKVSTLETLILLVELHRGVAFFPNVPQVTQDDRISYLSITNSPHHFQIVVGYPSKSLNTLTESFLSYVKETIV
ncbi:LysR family transcriptional regulator [Paenibacillus maysiensis]|uniref:LysR family transcriptional regulator n=1 Tax=Paenibacillus maysiensis TaxID=1155954 RepID=UPI00047193EE|nr:LysR family transcriptional regulator [Paenibacillus maysiensis]